MFALETRPVNNIPVQQSSDPFHPETHQGLSELKVQNLPLDENRRSGTRWTPTGFTIFGDNEFVGRVLKERFFHNPAVGYTLRLRDSMVVEYEFRAQAVGEFPAGSDSPYPR